ncbi:MAG: nucleoside kinase [Lachnospiraceae bacterium]|nr:nucleoside kinase [Lachnospiraceae bacterium]
MAKVTISGREYEYKRGTTYEEIAKDVQSQYDAKIILADVDGKYQELNKLIASDVDVEFVTMADKPGYKVLRRTMMMILFKAINDLYGDNNIDRVKSEFAIGKGIFCTVEGSVKVDDKFVSEVKSKMQEIIDADTPIVKTSYKLADAIKIFADAGMNDKVKLFNYRRTSTVNIYSIGDYKDYYHGDMAPSTSYAVPFDIYLYDEGFVLQFAAKSDLSVVAERSNQPKVFKAMRDTDKLGRQLGVETVGALNDVICSGGFEELRLVTEALQEGKISDIASDIAKRDGVKFVMIAGPSSSGKTSFSYRLSTQLMAHGLTPHPIGLDNYYVDRENCPKDENGNYDFECLESLDVEGFNSDMTKLLNGETVDIPVFNFKSGKREYHGNFLTLKENDILVIEGIHGLNEKMSYTLPSESKYKVYISALTCLNVDEHNRISTTDVRLIRRMVRDHRTRGTGASGTLAMWESVRRGEEKYIFPHQESADAVFNSALVYELAVLKQFAEPLLFGIKKDDPSYHEAKRLLKFLDYFLGVTSEDLPNNSILREFVGGSVFNV